MLTADSVKLSVQCLSSSCVLHWMWHSPEDILPIIGLCLRGSITWRCSAHPVAVAKSNLSEHWMSDARTRPRGRSGEGREEGGPTRDQGTPERNQCGGWRPWRPHWPPGWHRQYLRWIDTPFGQCRVAEASMLITTLSLHRRLSILRYVTHFICSRNLAIHKFTHPSGK